jgi:hypothetical protein
MKLDALLPMVQELRGKRAMQAILLPWREDRPCTICSLPSHAAHAPRPAVYAARSLVTNGHLLLCAEHATARFRCFDSDD